MSQLTCETNTTPPIDRSWAKKHFLEAQSCATSAGRKDYDRYLPEPTSSTKELIPRTGGMRAAVHEIQDPSATDQKYLVYLFADRQCQVRPVKSLPRAHERNRAAIALLKSWRSEASDTQEQRETLQFLKKALDQDRTSERKLFP